MNIIKQAMKFSMVGVVNTGITILTIFILTKVLNVNYVIANGIGYILGVINSFILNRKWTFNSNGHFGREGIRFLIVFAICYLFQLICLIILKEKLSINPDYSQLIAMVFYTGLNFILSKFYTFKNEVKNES